MDKLKSLQAELETARDALTALQVELPQFHALLTENERDAQRLKSERAPLDAQAQARGRVQIAKEMLEQHQSDIRTAQAEVARLEHRLTSEQTLDKMAQHASRANEHRAALEQAVEGAAEDLHRAAQTIIREWTAFEGAKHEFITAGAKELGPAQWYSEPVSIGLTGDAIGQLQEQVTSVLEAVKERGADLSGLLEGDVVALAYRIKNGERPLPTEGLAMLVWAAVLAHADVPHSLKSRAPKPKQPIVLATATGAGNRYSL